MPEIEAEILQQLIDAHGPALVLYARQWCRSPEDAVQETWIQLVKQSPFPERMAAWLYTTVRRRAMNIARNEARRRHHHQQSSQMSPEWFLPDENNAVTTDYQTHIAKLPRLQREILVARIWGELSFAEIADVVELSVSAVHRRYHEAIAELKQMMLPTSNPEHNHGVKSP